MKNQLQNINRNRQEEYVVGVMVVVSPEEVKECLTSWKSLQPKNRRNFRR